MAEFQEFLAALDTDPGNGSALAELQSLGPTVLNEDGATVALHAARRSLRQRGALEIVAKLFDVEIAAVTDDGRRADLLLEKGQLLAEDLLEEQSAVECFNQVLQLRPDDEAAQETLANFDLFRENWKKFVDKYLEEAKVSTDRSLTTSMYLSAAKTYARYQPGAEEVEKYLRKALDADPRNRDAAVHLERLLRREERWQELFELLQQRAEVAAATDERVHALVGVAELAREHLDREELALECMRKVVGLDAAHPRALAVLADGYEKEENWQALVMLYTNALKAQRRSGSREGDLGMLLQVAMLYWKRLDNADTAEEYFRRIRKVDGAHPAALDFYREYYPARDETGKLLQVLRQAQKATSSPDQQRALAVEMANLAETELGNPEKAVDSWKAILRDEPDSEEARDALRRLYRKTEGWNKLLDLMKEDVDRLAESDTAGRVAVLMQVVEIYRDRLKLPVMVINTYNTILKLDPFNRSALDDLTHTYKEMGRWNDLISVLTRKAEDPTANVGERAAILREVAELWSERFGNYAQAIKPLEQLIEIAPQDEAARNRLKDIYTRRRQWRALIGLLDTEAGMAEPAVRRDAVTNMARLASERLGDFRLAIELWNRVLELPGCEQDAEALLALSALYEREKRYLPLAEVYERQVALAGDDKNEAVAGLEKLGALLSDRLGAPAQAAEAFRRVLTFDPNHGRAMRTLRELYAAARDYDSLERMYGELGQWDELVDALSSIAERIEERDEKLALLERSGRLSVTHSQNKERIARAWERVLAVDPIHVEAARALIGVYRDTKKWARLLSTYEIILAHTGDAAEKLALHHEIRALAEEHLGSKSLAFQWTAKAYELNPEDDALLQDLERLGAEADAWEEVTEILDRRSQADDIGDAQRLHLLRELGKISMVRLHDPDRARGYQTRVLELSPEDPAAISALEDIATQLSDWPDLLKVYRRRVKLEKDAAARVDLLFRVAFIEEERVADLDAAAVTYLEILEQKPDSQRALRALSKIQEARGDWDGLAKVLERELGETTVNDERLEVLMRLGRLYEDQLGRPDEALTRYKDALALSNHRREVHEALERFLGADARAEHRVEVASLLLPIYESADDAAKIATALEVLRGAADPDEALMHDRRLVGLYGSRLADHARAYTTGLRVLEAAPDDRDNRGALLRYAGELAKDEELAEYFELALADAEERAIDPAERRALAAELAVMQGDLLGQSDKAQATWLKVLELEPTDGAAYEALDRIYRIGERWTELRDLLLRREQNTLDGDVRKAILLSICDLDEGVLEDADGAIAAYRKVLEIDPTANDASRRAYKALERLLEQKERWKELEELLGAELDYVEGQENIDLTYKRAHVRAWHLGDMVGAVDLLEDVVTRHRSHSDGRELLEELLPEAGLRLRVARLLEPLYEQDGLWKDLCLVLRAQREFAGSSHEAVDLLGRIARIEEEQLGHEKAAFETWLEAFVVEPMVPEPRAAVLRLGGLLDRWADVAATYEKVLAGAGDVVLQAEALAELAAVYDRNLADTDKAIATYERLIAIDPGNVETARPAAIALDRLYTEEQRWVELIDTVRRQAEWAETGEERKDQLARIGRLQEERLGDTAAAVTAWRELFHEDPEDPRGLDALERLYTADGQYRELIEVLRRRVERGETPEVKKEYLRRIAFLYEEQLEERAETIASHLEVLDYIPADEQTMSELARLYRAGERWMDLFEIVERQLSVAEDPARRLELKFQLGELLGGKLERRVDALERMAEVLSEDPTHAGALAVIEASIDDEDLRPRAAEVLEPIYESGAEYGKLAALLMRVAGGTHDVRERLRNLTRVAVLRERDLGDKPGAFEVYADAVRASVAEPELPELVKNLDRLAAELGREGDLIAIFKDVAPDVLDGDLQRRLYLDIADLARALHDDESLAREYYQLVLDGAPDDARALAALESIYRNAGEHQRLFDVLSRKAELAGDRFDVRVAALSEAAALCGAELDRPEEAAMAWEQVLEIAPDNKDAAAALEKLYTKATRWHDLVNLTERRLGFAFTVEEAVALRFRLGEIYEQHLLDPDAAVENFSAAVGGDPTHAGATTALERALDDPGSRTSAAEVLEPIYVSRQDWPKLVRIYEIKLEAAEDPTERLKLTRYIARLYEEQLEDLEGAFRWYGRVFRESPADRGIRDQLGRLATILEAWEGLANVYQEYLDDEPGDLPEARAVALTLAELYDRRLDEVELGQTAYRRALQSDPEDIPTFQRLEAMLIRAERWYALVDCYEEIVQATMDDERRKDLYLRAARVQRDHLKDAARAIEGLRAVLDIDPDAAAANEELDALFEAQSQWYELADLLLARIARAERPEMRNALRMRLANVRETRLKDLQAAIDQYEEVLQSGVGLDLALPQLERLVVNEDVRERIAELLEPVYRENDWWQKLVVILDAKLQFVDDPERRVAMLREIAQIHESRGGDQDLALEALSRAWKSSPSSDEVLAELTVLATKLSAWDRLVATLEEGVKASYDYDLNARILARIAEVHEHQRRDNKKATAAWLRVLEISDEDPRALEALDRLYVAQKKPAELVGVLQRRADRADDDTARVALLHRIAELQENDLRRPPEAIAAYRAVLNVDDSDAAALDALERLYRGEKDWSELSTVLMRKIELCTDADARRALRFSAAEVSDTHLNDVFEAVSQYNAVLEEDPSDAEALAELDRIFLRDKMWAELVEVLDKRAELETDTEARAEFGFRAAEVVGKELFDLERSLDRYAMVLQVDAKHPGARKALDALTRNEDMLARASAVLERLYGNDADFDAIAELYERRLAVPANDLELRKQQYARLVELHEVSRGDSTAAFEVLSRALAEAPDDTRVQGELERLAASRGSWDELVELYEKRLADTLDAELEYTYAAKLAGLYEEAVGDLDRAAERWRRALDVASDERTPLAALDRIYGRASRFEELAQILAREAEATLEADEQAAFLFRLGDTREQSLSDPTGAVSAYRDVLDRAPGHGAARGALERMMAHESERREIVGILEPLYEGEGEWGRLADLLVAKLSVTDDPFDRAITYGRIAEISERELADPVRALDAVGGWLAEDPRSDQALAELGRLAEVCNRWDEVAARLRGIIDAADSDDVRRPLLLELGEVQLDNQGDVDAAEHTYRAVLELDAECGPALVALDRIYRQRNDAASLADILWRRGQLAFDAAHKRQAYVEVAQLREHLGEVPRAIEAWREVMDLDEGDREAHGRLAALYEHGQQWNELIDVLGVAARFSGGGSEEAQIRTRIAQLYANTVGDLGAAVDAWQNVLDVDPESPVALESLLDVHARREDWLAVQEVLTRKLDMVGTDSERIEIYAQMADIAFDKRQSVDDAIGYLYQILDLDNAHFDTYKRLERVLGKAERWHDLVELLEREGDVYGTLGHNREEVDCLARAADVFEGPLGDPVAAGEILEKIIRREPNYIPALTRLSKIYEAEGDWDKCGEVLQRAASLGPTGNDAAELYFRLGEVERQKGGDDNLAMARQHWTTALQHAPQHLPSVVAFEKLARDDEDWPLVADMVARREAVSQDPAEKLELGLELATLYGRKLGQPQQAIPLLEAAVQLAPEDPRVLGPLADLYFQARMHDRAAPIYDKLADEARKSRRMKDVALYRQRQAGILESQGDIDGALSAYEEAFRVNPTDSETMAGLGRIYMARQAWDKARRVYRSMVLQNLDPDLGVTKAEVYYHLGTIHVQMNEPAKAKGMFQRGLELEPDNQALKQALDSL